MLNRNRLVSGGSINRNKIINFKFNGQELQGFEGDTLASALLANDIHLIGRSFKYHRPRGILTAGSEEPNALVQLETGSKTEPNARATEIELYEGLIATSQNCWPSVKYDIGALNNLFSRILPAGFYYKTFMWPPSMWLFYEHFIRKAAGLGEAPKKKNPDRYEQKFFYCDVMIIGGGVNGLVAALAAARSGAKVLIVDEKKDIGGYLLNTKAKINSLYAQVWIKETLNELHALKNVTILNRTTATGYYDYNYITALQKVTNHEINPNKKLPRERFWRIRSKEVILAQGAFERPLVFSGNDKPGIMMASAAQVYMSQYGVLPGNSITLFTNNDHAYSVALEANLKGAKVIIIDIRHSVSDTINKLCEENKIETYVSHAITSTHGSKKVNAITLQELSSDKQSFVGEAVTIGTDLLLMSGGWNPAVQLFSQSRGKLRYSDEISSFVPDVLIDHQYVVGCNNGEFNLRQSLLNSFQAGISAAHQTGHKIEVNQFIDDAVEPYGFTISDVVPYVLGSKPVTHGSKHFIDFQNDVTAADIFLAQREGYVSVEHTKRYTTTGMATDQGKTSNVNALAIMSHIQNKPVGEVGHTTFRPPYVPQTFGAIAGRNVDQYFDPERHTAIHQWHIDNGAVFEDVGQWKRPHFYPKNKESMNEAVNRECIAARKSVGILDASTLGKIDIQGPDAAKFLNLIYTNAWSKLEIGACRYGLMCNEHGMVFDDGVTTRISENHYHMTTTTGGAARVMSWLEEFLQTEWLDMKVYCTSVTEQWTVLSICGPKSRDLLSSLTEENITNESLPYMRMKKAKICGIDARIFRISFTGELSFEINIPSRYGRYVWDKVIDAGKKFNITPYGTETMHVLRAEKGFIIVGQDTDGSATPSDLNMDWIVSKKKEDFLGKRSFARSDTVRENRKHLVGLLINDKKTVVPEGSHIVDKAHKKPPMKMSGHITSSYHSPTLGYPIAMAMLKNGKNRSGDTVLIPLMNGKLIEATVTDSVFYDKEGLRQND